MNKIIWIFIFSMCASVAVAATDNRAERRAAAIEKCETIDPGKYQTGLLFNPDGYRSYYVRSECFQRVAKEFRDLKLCKKVRRRLSLFSSSWGYSKKNCRKLVKEKIDQDRAYIKKEKAKFSTNPVRLTDFTITANGNGRDFDIAPVFTSGYGHGYQLYVTLIDPQDNNKSALIHSSGHYLSGREKILIYLPTKDIRKRFPEFTLDRPYTVEARLVVTAGSASMNQDFINKVWPLEERTQIMTKTVSFSLPKRRALRHDIENGLEAR